MMEKSDAIDIGPQWCADPNLAIRTRPSEDYVEPPRRVIHYQTQTRQDSVTDFVIDEEETIDDEEAKDGIMNDDFEAETVRSEDDHELDAHPDTYADAVDIDELSKVCSVTERMLTKNNELRTYADLGSAHETASVTRNKDLFQPRKIWSCSELRTTGATTS